MKEQKTDTTLFMSNIKKAGRIFLAYDVLFKAVGAIHQERLMDFLKRVLELDFKHEIADDNGIEIHLTDMTGREPTKEISATDFEIDEDTNIIKKCPGGYTPINAGVSKSQTSAHFPHEACENYPLKAQCYSKKQVKSCVVRIQIKTVKPSRVRLEIKENKKGNTSKRAGIEGSNSALKRKGFDKLNVRGKSKVKVVGDYKVIVQNISRYVKFMLGGYKPKVANIPHNEITVPIFS